MGCLQIRLKAQSTSFSADTAACGDATSSSSIAVERLSPKIKKVRNDPSCAVCMEVFAGEDKLNVLPCQHYFHETCTQGWLADHNSCPMCKSKVSVTPEK